MTPEEIKYLGRPSGSHQISPELGGRSPMETYALTSEEIKYLGPPGHTVSAESRTSDEVQMLTPRSSLRGKGKGFVYGEEAPR